MNLQETLQLIGKPAVFHGSDGFDIPVVIRDARDAYGRKDYRLENAANTEQLLWKSADRVTILSEQREGIPLP